jgi:hypothetical protein
MDDLTLTALLRGEHFSIPERLDRGVWPHPPLKFGELVQHLAEILRTVHWFPHEWRAPTPGDSVSEWPIVEKRGPGNFICYAQHADPADPRRLGNAGQISFKTPEGAARWYLKWALNLPGDLDGWTVI